MVHFDFLISTERSGSNLLTRIMDAHSSICGPPPAHLIRILNNNRLNYGNLNVDENWNALLDDTADLLKNQLGEWKISVTQNWLHETISVRSLPAVIKSIFTAEAHAHGKSRLFVKENQAYHLAAFYLAHFKDCRFVHLVRDPRDMALSWKLSVNHPGGVVRAARVWQTDQNLTMILESCIKDTNRFYRIRYEDLLGNSKNTLKELCEFLNIDIEENMLFFNENGHTRHNANRIKDWENLGKPLLKNNYNKYSKCLSREEIICIETVCGVNMRKLGYQPDYPTHILTKEQENELNRIENDPMHPSSELSEKETEIRKGRLAVIHRIASRTPFDN